MKLRKDKWPIVKLNQLFLIERGGSPRPIDDYFTDDDNGINWVKIGDTTEVTKYVYHTKQKIKPEGIKSSRMVYDGDFILSNSMSFGRPYIMKTTGCIHDGWLLLREKVDNIDKEFLYTVLSSDTLFLQFKKYAAGTTVKNLNIEVVKKVEIPLPPLEEQKQIAALFQSIETAMEQVDGQEKNLKALWKRLIDEFVSEKPSFGNLLKGKKLKTYNYCDVTEKLMRKIDPLTYGIERIVAGENLESEDFKIRTWQNVGEGYLGPAFHVLFKAGDILYGSRRTYLRKVSLADFDGVCANTTYVIRANEDILLQDLLKHIMLSERFTQYSIGVSKGSTNPYINWKDLDNFSFQIPDLKTQKEIVNVLDGILAIVEQLKQQKATLKLLKQKLLNEILG